MSKCLQDPNLAQLNLEKACLNFIQKGQGAEKNILIDLLEEIDKALIQEAFQAQRFQANSPKMLKI